GLAGTLAALVQVAPPSCLPDCDPDDINGFDRSAVGYYSESAHTIASWGVIGLVVLPVLINALDSQLDGWVEDTVVYTEILLATQAMVQLFKFAVDRPAPFVYGSDAPPSAHESPDASRSFISGHAAMSFAAATAFATTFWHRNPDSPWRWLVIGLGGAAAS